MKQERQFTLLLGASGAAVPRADTDGFLHAEAEVRARLGGDAHLLDACLDRLLDALNALDAQETVVEGFEAGSILAGIVRYVLGMGHENQAGHPFVPAVRAFVEAHPLPYDDKVQQASVYYIAMADKWREACLDEAAKAFQGKILTAHVIPAEADSLYEQICARLGDDALLDRMVDSFLSRHRMVSPMTVFAQGLASHLNYEMMGRDHENTTTSYRLWVDSGIGTMQ